MASIAVFAGAGKAAGAFSVVLAGFRERLLPVAVQHRGRRDSENIWKRSRQDIKL